MNNWRVKLIALVIMAAIFVVGFVEPRNPFFVEPVAAAAPLAVPVCLPINSAGLIVVYRCEPNEGLPYLLNSAGFMLFED